MSTKRDPGPYWAKLRAIDERGPAAWSIVSLRDGGWVDVLGDDQVYREEDIAEWWPRIPQPPGSLLPDEWADVVAALREVEKAAREVARPRGEMRTRLEVALDAAEEAENRRVGRVLDRLEREHLGP